MQRWLFVVFLVVVVFGAVLMLQKGDGETSPDRTSTAAEVILARDRAAEFAILTEWEEARRSLAPLVEKEDAAAEDLVRAALIELADHKDDVATKYIARADAIAPRDPGLLWSKYRAARGAYENDEALAALTTFREVLPDDIPAQLAIAILLQDLGRYEEAETAYADFLAIPKAYSGAWRMTALYRARQLLLQQGRAEESTAYLREFEELDESGVTAPGEPEFQAGTLGAVAPHSPSWFEITEPELDATFSVETLDVIANFRGARAVRLGRGTWERDLGHERGRKKDELKEWQPEDHRIAAWGASGLRLFERNPAGAWTLVAQATDESILDAIPFDRMNQGAEPESQQAEAFVGDRDLDFLVLVERGDFVTLQLLESSGGEWNLRADTLLTTEAKDAAGRIAAVDFDHDGDLDVIAGLADGLRLLRNDGFDLDARAAEALTAAARTRDPDAPAVAPGTLTDITSTMSFPAGDYRVEINDVDADQDVDLVLVDRSGGAVRLLDNERGGVFSDGTDELPTVSGSNVLCADFDGSSWPGLASLTSTNLSVQRQTVAGAWQDPLEWKVSSAPTGPPVAVDIDLDGTTDIVWPAEGVGIAGVLSPGFENGVPFDLGGVLANTDVSSIQVVDIDGDFDQDILALGPDGAREVLSDGGLRGLRLELMGYSSNSIGTGAIVEVREDQVYRRFFWHGEDTLIGVGDVESLDALRVTWTHGVVQNHFDLPIGASYLVQGRVGLQGSCPFLYTWNGETYEYITDVLGITPLGLPMAPGMIVPPDHDEFVLVRGDQLRPKDGVYELQFTEELREVTYLDRIRLDVVDHPADIEIFPNERFDFPPFPEHHTHTIQDPLVPLAARDGRGREWTSEVERNDDVLAAPFDPVPSGQFQGLARPHVLDLEFDAARIANAKKLRLVMNGWFFWTNASVNVAAARHPEHAFIPPMLQVPDGEGGWRDTGPPIGFPAGKLKTMVVDVTDLIVREDPRIRLFSTLRLYWDSIRLAVDEDDGEMIVTQLEPASAELWDRGFSEPILSYGPYALEWFKWENVAATPRWNQHPGMYTRYGATLPLVTEVDDRFVVMGAGDALTVRFDADSVPPLRAGWKRDYLVYMDGWAKDRDPNTAEALYVEPLPFHGMSSYPYGPDEAFPDDEVHREWRREWQTRPAKGRIDPLVPTSRRFPRPIARASATGSPVEASASAR